MAVSFPQAAGDAGQHHHRHIGYGYIDQSGHADFENFGEQRPLKRHSAE